MGTTIKVQRYSESFKRQVVQEYEEGASASSLQRITRINQVWVVDITYILTEQGYLYLALI